MTIDERLESLTKTVEKLAEAQVKQGERVDALTQSVELIAQMQAKTEKEVRLFGRYVRTIVLDHEARLLALEDDGDSPEDQANPRPGRE